MGRNKALLELGGRPLIEHVIDAVRPLCGEILIIAPEASAYLPFGLPVKPDLRPGLGSLGGIHAALSHAAGRYTLCVACDMPFVSRRLAAFLIALSADGYDAVVPRLDAGPEPLFALYSPRLLPAIESRLNRGEMKITGALDGARTRWVDDEEARGRDPDLRSFFNVNTPGDLERGRRLLGEESP